MLWTIFVILLVLWLLGVVSSYTLGGFIHILLVIALVVLVLQLLSGAQTDSLTAAKSGSACGTAERAHWCAKQTWDIHGGGR